MENVEIDARLDLIQLTANVVNGEFESPNGDEDDQLLDLIEALCRYRNVPVAGVLSPVAIEILRTRSPEELGKFARDHKLTIAI